MAIYPKFDNGASLIFLFSFRLHLHLCCRYPSEALQLYGALVRASVQEMEQSGLVVNQTERADLCGTRHYTVCDKQGQGCPAVIELRVKAEMCCTKSCAHKQTWGSYLQQISLVQRLF